MPEREGVVLALKRRWPLAALGLLATALLCMTAVTLVSPQYEVTARVLLVPPPPADKPTANPLLGLGGLEPAASVLAKTMSAAESVRAFREAGASGAFTITPDFGTSGPVLLFAAQGQERSQALGTLALLLDQTPLTLERLQAQIGVTRSTAITSILISRDDEASVIRKRQIRAVVVALGAGGAGTLLGVSLLDALLCRRAARRPVREPSHASARDPGREPVHVLQAKARPVGPDSVQQSSVTAEAAS